MRVRGSGGIQEENVMTRIVLCGPYQASLTTLNTKTLKKVGSQSRGGVAEKEGQCRSPYFNSN